MHGDSFLNAFFLVLSSRETTVKENRCFFGGAIVESVLATIFLNEGAPKRRYNWTLFPEQKLLEFSIGRDSGALKRSITQNRRKYDYSCFAKLLYFGIARPWIEYRVELSVFSKWVD